MTTDLFTDRSRYLAAGRCRRQRWWEYEYLTPSGQRGIVPVRRSLALSVGGAVHEGLAAMLQWYIGDRQNEGFAAVEEIGVQVALADFLPATEAGLEPELGERLGMQTPETVAEALEGFGSVTQEDRAALLTVASNGAAEFDRHLRAEQTALVEALVRCWARRGLRRLLEEYEVLEVEREGRWELARWVDEVQMGGGVFKHVDRRLWFLSRPDALLRHRVTGDLVLQSFKTTGQWDQRKARDAERDVQGLTEGVEVERRLGEWWQALRVNGDTHEPISPGMREWLLSLPAPPRISAIRYEYLLKGERSKQSRLAKSLSDRCGFEARVQQSPLVYRWVNMGMTVEDIQFAHSFAWTGEDGKEHKLAWQKWNQEAVFNDGRAPAEVYRGMTKAWIDALDAGVIQPEAGRDVLAEQLLAPIMVQRTDDDLRDVLEQLEATETRIAQDTRWVEEAGDEGERRSRLNQRFPQTRAACSWPGECDFVKVCYGGPLAQQEPLGTGLYQIRVPNHPEEASDGENS